MLADTDVLIWFFRGRRSARSALQKCAAVELSAITYMELAQGVRDGNELKILRRAVRENGWSILPVSESVSYRAMALIESYAVPRGLRVADALIAATSIEHGLTLMTANVRHYRRLPGISLRPYRP